MPENSRSARLKEFTDQIEAEHSLYAHELDHYQTYVFRRIEKDIELAYRERALEARKTAFLLQKERQDLVRKSWIALLEKPCDEEGLFSERLMLPYYLALYRYQSIFPAEQRGGSLLLSQTGR